MDTATTSFKNGDAPYGSAIVQPIKLTSTAKFKNTKALADYLILLDKNDTLYNEYFWWKPYFQVENSENEKKKSMFRLCAALHDETLPSKTYDNFTDWWDTQSACIFSPKIFVKLIQYCVNIRTV